MVVNLQKGLEILFNVMYYIFQSLQFTVGNNGI